MSHQSSLHSSTQHKAVARDKDRELEATPKLKLDEMICADLPVVPASSHYSLYGGKLLLSSTQFVARRSACRLFVDLLQCGANAYYASCYFAATSLVSLVLGFEERRYQRTTNDKSSQKTRQLLCF